MPSATPPVARAPWPLWGLRGALAVLGGLLLVNFAKMLFAAWFALVYPYDLDYGEGIVWQQMRNIVAGHGYSPLGVYPGIVYHYPPVYHLTTAAFAALTGLDQLLAGRLVSLLSFFASMLLVADLAMRAMPEGRGRAARWGAAAIGALSLASMPTVVTWATLMRVDMLGCALTLGGLALAIRGIEKPWAVPLAAFAFVLAIYTKQTSIAGPIAAFAGLWLVRPRAALTLLAWCLGLGLLALALLSYQSRGGFLRHILLYNINRVQLERWKLLLVSILSEGALVLVASVGIAAACRHLGSWRTLRATITGNPHKAALLILLLFVAVKTAMLPMILKSGANHNYLLEWSCGLAVFVALAAGPVLDAARGAAAWPSPIFIALLLVALPLTFPTPETDPITRPAGNTRMAAVVDQIRASAKPVISDDMVLLIRAGRPVEWEPAIAAELAHAQVYDEAAFVAMVRRGDFGFFLTRGDRRSRLFAERYNPAVADAIDAAYPRKREVDGLVFHLPR